MDRHTIRSTILNHLKAQPDTQLNNIAGAIDQQFGQNKSREFRKEIFEEIHLLMLNNIVMVGHNYGQWEHPWLELTNYGRKCIEEDRLVPLDPDGYIARILKDIPTVDSTVIEYLTESISAFNRDLLLSSTITLGVASEQSMLLLMESFASYVANEKPTIKEKLLGDDSIFKKYRVFREALMQLPNKTKEQLPENFDVHIDTLFNFIRLNRNETGHPVGGGKDKSVLAANLQAFKSYLANIYKLIACFQSSK